MKITQGKTYTIDGKQVQATILQVELRDDVHVGFDRELVRKGMVASGQLIDQRATAQQRLKGREAGYFLREYLSTSSDGSVACKLGQNLWTPEFLVINGKMIAYDQPVLPDGTYTTLIRLGGGWYQSYAMLDDGVKLIDDPDRTIAYVMPTLASRGKLRNFIEVVQEYRSLTDLRNFFDLAQTSNPQVHLYLRRFPVNQPEQAVQLANGDSVTIKIEAALSSEEFDDFHRLIAENRLDHLYLSEDGSHQSLTFEGPVPRNRIPLVVPIATATNDLAVMFFDGRVPNSAGITVMNAAKIALQEFPGSSVFMGAAGGDTQLAQKDRYAENGWKFRNSPPGGQERRVPDALIIEPGD